MLICCHICFQKSRYVFDRLITILKSRMRRGSYIVDDEESLNVAPSPRRQKSSNCLNKLEQLMDKDEKQLKQDQQVGLSDNIDITSRYLFPTSFLMFNIFYWIAYVYDIRVLPENARDI